MSTPIRIRATGVLNKDIDRLYINEGDYIEAVNIRHQDHTGNTIPGPMPINGNTLAVNIPKVSAISYKKFRVYIRKELFPSPAFDPDPKVGTMLIRDGGNTYVMDSSDGNSLAPLANYSTLSGYYTDLVSRMDDDLVNSTAFGANYSSTPAFLYSALTSTSSTTGYFDVTQNAIVDLDFDFAQVTGNLVEKIELIEQYIPQADELKVVGSGELNGDVFIISASEPGYLNETISEIGVLEYFEDVDNWLYTRLLRTTKFGFSSEYRCQVITEIIGGRVGLFITDQNSKPRTVYVPRLSSRDTTTGSYYEEDACLVQNGGSYNYSSIDEETYMFINAPKATLEFVSVNEGGGRLTAGNKRYTGRFLTEDFGPTEFIPLTNPVNVYMGSISSPTKISGGLDGEVTDKSVSLMLNDIPTGAYKYFELCVIEYLGDTVSANIVQRYSIDSNSAMLITHSDVGQENIEIGLNEVLSVSMAYSKVGSIAMQQGRMFASKLEEQIDEDLSAWASDFNHELKTKTITSVGLMGDLNLGDPEYRLGEYQDPTNVHYFPSHMYMDTYRFGVKVRWKSTGKWSRAYWVDDIRFDSAATNVTTPDRRTGSGLVMNLTDITLDNTNVFYVEFSNIDLTFLVNGFPLYTLIDAYEIVRAERIPEVLFTGGFLAGISPGGINIYPADYYGPTVYPSTRAAPETPRADYMYGFIPDMRLGKLEYQLETGDQLILFGPPDITNYQMVDNLQCTGGSVIQHSYIDNTGYFSATGADEQETATIIEAKKILSGSYISVNSDVVNTDLIGAGTGAITCDIVLSFTSAFPLAFTYGTNKGFLYGAIFRDKGAHLKYPANKELTTYYSCGAIQEVTSGSTVDTVSVYGDVYNQKTHTPMTNGSFAALFGSGFYSQNTVNSQMRHAYESSQTTGYGYLFPQLLDNDNAGGPNRIYPVGSFGNGLSYLFETRYATTWQDTYDRGYSHVIDILPTLGYDPADTNTGKHTTRIAYSQRRQSGSEKNNYRIFKPADFIDLDPTHGDVSHIAVVNGSLYSWQLDSFRRHYVNESSALTSNTGTEVIIGAGGVLPNVGVEISSIGTDKKWSIVKGITRSGKDTVYWFNDKFRKLMRFGTDGARCISDRKMKSWFFTNANFLRDHFEPIRGQGIHGVWNDRYDEAIFTFKGFSSEIPLYASGVFAEGDMVYNPGELSKHYTGLPYIYIANQNFTVSSDDQEPGVGVDWQDYWDRVHLEDLPQYYTCLTIAYCEPVDGFRALHTYYPNIYMPVLNTFYSPDPSVVLSTGTNTEQIYMHDLGNEMTFYGNAFDGSITPVLNYEPNVIKIFEAIQVVSDIIPYRLDFTTENHTSFLNQSDFTTREDFHYSPILNNAVAGVVTGDSSRLYGKYLEIKFTFQNGTYQRWFNCIVKLRLSPRLFSL